MYDAGSWNICDSVLGSPHAQGNALNQVDSHFDVFAREVQARTKEMVVKSKASTATYVPLRLRQLWHSYCGAVPMQDVPLRAGREHTPLQQPWMNGEIYWCMKLAAAQGHGLDQVCGLLGSCASLDCPFHGGP